MAKTRLRTTTPVPAVDELIKTYGIAPGRAKKVLAMLDEMVERRQRAEAARSPKQHPRLKRRSKP